MTPMPFDLPAATAALLLVTSTVAVGQETLTPDETALLPRLIDSACVEIVEASDGCEQVVLVASDTVPDRADMIILRDWRTEPASEPLLIARSAAFNGSMWGMEPSLDVTEDGSLRLSSQQTGLGRYPWFQTLTIAYRDERFVLAGFTYTTYDRGAGGGMQCDVNLLTGEFEVEATQINAETEEAETTFIRTGMIDPLDLDAANIGTNAPFPAPCEEGLAALETF